MHAMWLIFVVTLVASLVLTPLARWLAARFNVVDAPDGKRKLQSNPVPLWAGVAVYLALVSGLAAAQISYGSLLLVCASAVCKSCLLCQSATAVWNSIVLPVSATAVCSVRLP